MKVNLTDFLTIIGTIASLGGAIFSWFQFKKASNSAKEAKETESRIIIFEKKKKALVEVEKIKVVVDKLSKYIRQGSSKGLKLEKDLDEVISLRNKIKSNSQFSETFEEELKQILDLRTEVNLKSGTEKIITNTIILIMECLTKIASEMDREVNTHD